MISHISSSQNGALRPTNTPKAAAALTLNHNGNSLQSGDSFQSGLTNTFCMTNRLTNGASPKPTLGLDDLTGRVLRPEGATLGDSDPNSASAWQEALVHFCGRIPPKEVEPKALVFVQNPKDVQNALQVAKDQNLPVRIRCGGHSYEAYSLVKDGLVIDVTDMNQIEFQPKDGTVTVGAGCRVHDISQALSKVDRCMPLPTFPSVGISGATLGGGVGLTSRKHGLTCDNLLSAQVVLADGRLVTASQKENPDLFWALRGGGGGNFGVVTSFTFQTHPVQHVAAFEASWDWKQFDQVVDAWQKWAPNCDDRVTPVLALRADHQIKLYGQFTPDSDRDLAQAPQLLQQLYAQVPPQTSSLQALPTEVASRVFGQLQPDSIDWRKDLREEQLFKSTSAVAFQPLPAEAITNLRQQLESSPRRAGEVNPNEDMVQLLPGGGASSRTPIGDTGVYSRKAQFILQYDAYWEQPQDEKVNTQWVEGLRDSMLDYAQGAYVNYHDSLLEDPLVSYYGPNLPRLVEVKKTYDPENFFHYPQSIPLQLSEPQAQACQRLGQVAAA